MINDISFAKSPIIKKRGGAVRRDSAFLLLLLFPHKKKIKKKTIVELRKKSHTADGVKNEKLLNSPITKKAIIIDAINGKNSLSK